MQGNDWQTWFSPGQVRTRWETTRSGTPGRACYERHTRTQHYHGIDGVLYGSGSLFTSVGRSSVGQHTSAPPPSTVGLVALLAVEKPKSQPGPSRPAVWPASMSALHRQLHAPPPAAPSSDKSDPHLGDLGKYQIGSDMSPRVSPSQCHLPQRVRATSQKKHHALLSIPLLFRESSVSNMPFM